MQSCARGDGHRGPRWDDVERPADTGRSLIARSRGIVYAVAAALLAVAVVLAALRVGERAGSALRLAGASCSA